MATRTIFYYLWLQLKRSKIQLLFLGVVVVCSLYSFYYGNQFTRQQKATIASVKNAEAKNIRELIAYTHLDTTLPANAKLFKSKTSPFGADPLLAKSVIFYPSGLSSLVVGQKDVFPYYRTVGGRSLYYTGGAFTTNGTFKEIRNPEQLLAGNFDFSFVVIYLIPLLIISFCYNLLAEEKERGTFSLLQTVGISTKRVVGLKLLFYLALVSAVLSAVYIIGAFFSIQDWPNEWPSFLKLWFSMGLYGLLWFSLCFMIISFRQSSAVSALLLLAAWLFLCVVLPGVANSFIDAKKPIASPAELSTTLQLNNDLIWYRLADDTAFYHTAVKELKAKLPRFASLPERDSLDKTTQERLMLWHVMFDIMGDKEISAYETSLRQRDEVAKSLQWINPVSSLQSYQAHFAGTDKEAYDHYRQTIVATQKIYQDSLFTAVLSASPLSTIGSRYPEPVAIAPVPKNDFRPMAAIMAVYVVLFFIIGWFLLNRNTIK